MHGAIRNVVRAACVAAAVLVALPARAQRSDGPVPIYVLPVTTEDADDQADALTKALRARVRAMPGWSLEETSQSFETLAIALRCPPKPDEGCLGRIGEQLQAEHYIWGTMTRAHGQVTVELRLWTAAGPDAQVSATFSESLKDPENRKLRAVASRLVDTLTNSSLEGTLVVHAGSGNGAVVIDGIERSTLSAGTARVGVGQGAHIVRVRVPGFVAAEQTVDVAAASPANVTFALTPAKRAEPVSGSPIDTRKLLAYGGIGGGALLLVAGAVEVGRWADDKKTSDSQRALVPASIHDVCAAQGSLAAAAACQTTKSQETAAVLAWVFTIAGVAAAGTGAWLLVTSQPSAHPTDEQARRTIEILPTLGLHHQSLDLRLTF